MIDVQIVAGRRPELLYESLSRILAVPQLISHIYIANNTGKCLNSFDSKKVTVVDNCSPKTFEQNHNLLAKYGTSEYILFLDDDAFIFPGSVELLFKTINSNQDVLLVGGVNNQTWSRSNQYCIPKVTDLEYFKAHKVELERIAREAVLSFGTQKELKLFCPGNLILTRRTCWQQEYGGWDESYKNWNEEIDYILWGYERAMRTLVMPGVWFFHGMSSSRVKSCLVDNIVDSSCHLISKFPVSRVEKLADILSEYDPRLRQGLLEFIEFNRNCMLREFVISSDYYKKITPFLFDEAV